MFQFSRLPLSIKNSASIEAGFPIRESPAEVARHLSGAYRSLATPFIGFWHQGIPHMPLVA
tara:strand:+ start:24 stop:206 length:183 start_codon:yes stop_codon:yes gene_type:complete